MTYVAEPMPGASDFTIAVFDAKDVPAGTAVVPKSSLPDEDTIIKIIRASGYCTFSQACEIAGDIMEEWRNM